MIKDVIYFNLQGSMDFAIRLTLDCIDIFPLRDDTIRSISFATE